MIIVVGYLPSVLWSTALITVEHINFNGTFFFVEIIGHGVMLRLNGSLLGVLVLPIMVRVGGTSGIIIRVIAILRRAVVRTCVECAGTTNMS